jgi:hypothetical protein
LDINEEEDGEGEAEGGGKAGVHAAGGVGGHREQREADGGVEPAGRAGNDPDG